MSLTIEGSSVKDTNVNEVLDFVATASAVNQLAATNAATAGKPILGVAGDDANIGMAIQPKGTGLAQINDGNGNEVLKTSSVASAINELTAKNAAAGSPPELQATGDDTNIDAKITPKGTGRVLAGVGLQIGATSGAANSAGLIVKSLTALADATDGVLGVITVPNALLGAGVRVTVMGALGDGDSVQVAVYTIAISRVSGANAKAVVSAEGVAANTAGATANADVAVSVSAVSGAVGASNSFNIQARVTRSAGASTNHFITAEIQILNALASGVTVA